MAGMGRGSRYDHRETFPLCIFFVFVCLLITKTFHHLSCRREEKERAPRLIVPKENGNEELCEVFTDDDTEGGASERPGSPTRRER